MSKPSAIVVDNVYKSYKLFNSARDRLKEAFHPRGKKYHHAFHALSGVSLDIPRGTTAAIVGRNGSGKSTLLQCICGISDVSSGGITVNGRIAALLELGAGFNPEFTGRDNLYMNAALLGLPRAQVDERLDDILAFAGIGEFIDQPVRSYSSGMFVRLAFSIAIHVDPDILIVDEALAVGDIHFQAKCYERFHQFREQGVTVIFVTHDLNMVTRYCDTAYLLSHGEIVAQGVPREVVSEYRRLEVGGGKPPNQEHSEDGMDKQSLDDTLLANPYEKRYGNGKAVIEQAVILDQQAQVQQVLTSGESYTIKMRVQFCQDVEAPVFAFTITDIKGTAVTGTNTRYQDVQTTGYKSGDVVDVLFTQHLPLVAGNYLLSLGCISFEGDEVVVHERRHGYVSFEVVSKSSTIGMIAIQSQVEITAANAAHESIG